MLSLHNRILKKSLIMYTCWYVRQSTDTDCCWSVFLLKHTNSIVVFKPKIKIFLWGRFLLKWYTTWFKFWRNFGSFAREIGRFHNVFFQDSLWILWVCYSLSFLKEDGVFVRCGDQFGNRKYWWTWDFHQFSTDMER